MRRMSKIGVTGAALALATVGLSSPAQAASSEIHRGKTGCFSWSWAEGWTTTTVYYRNTCSYEASMNVWWQDGRTSRMKKVTAAGGASGSVKNSGDFKRID